MTKEEFAKIVNALRSNYQWMLESDEEVLSWFTFLKNENYEDVRRGITRIILNNPKPPTVAEVMENTAAARREYRMNSNMNTERAVHCIYCKDTGLIVTQSPTGVMLGHPCDKCKRGREKYPWNFLDAKEQRDFIDQEIRKGRNIQKPIESPKDFYMAYVYGGKK